MILSEGFGGAFTEAAAVTINKLSRENRDKILKLYFSENEGIGYNVGRVHMNSYDFSEGCYEYSKGQMDTYKIGEKYAHDMNGNFETL